MKWIVGISRSWKSKEKGWDEDGTEGRPIVDALQCWMAGGLRGRYIAPERWWREYVQRLQHD
jgi:hypothetical protein